MSITNSLSYKIFGSFLRKKANPVNFGHEKSRRPKRDVCCSFAQSSLKFVSSSSPSLLHWR